MQRVFRVERHTPDIRGLQQHVHDILKVDQTRAAAQVGSPIPGLETGAQRGQGRTVSPQASNAHLQQVRHDLAGQVNLVVHDHVLQVLDLHRAGLGQLPQILQGKAGARPQGLSGLTDQRRVTGQWLSRVSHPRRVIGVLHKVSAQQLR
ncbi:hypothetical protein D3C75_973100 [compost metagenome]